MLPTRQLGTTPLRIGVLGLGTVKLGRNTGVRYPHLFEIPDDDAAGALLARAADLGINLLDTAPAYGDSEERLGRLLPTLPGGRDRWVICTKAGEEYDRASDSSTFDFSAKAVAHSIDRSLRRLRTDRVELALIHSDGADAEILRHGDAVGALRRLQREGKVGHVGISVKTLDGALLAVEQCDVVMLTLNLAEREAEPALHAAAAKGVGVLVKKPLAAGHTQRLAAERLPWEHEAAEADAGGDRGSPDPVEASFRYIFSQPGISGVVVGTIDPVHLEHNVRAAVRALGVVR